MVQNAGFVDSNRSSLIPFKIEGETIVKSESDNSNVEVYDYSGFKISSAYIVSNTIVDSAVVPVKLGANVGFIARVSANTDIVIGYTNGDAELRFENGAPIRYVNVRLNGHVMSGKPTAPVTYGQSLAYSSTVSGIDGYPALVVQTGTLPAEGSRMLALDSATSSDVTAKKLIDYLILL